MGQPIRFNAVAPDIGIFAGFDPVALDKACIGAVNAVPGIKTSRLASQIAHAEKTGLGVGKYELITVK
jgi:uncharacterized Fe-S center protein